MTTPPRPDYGLDAPGLGRGLFAAGAVSAALGLTLRRATGLRGLGGSAVVGGLMVVAAYCLGMGGLMRYASRVGKLAERERLLDLIPWSGDESVLDAGCGRGLMLVGAAKRLTTGRAVGVDIWRAVDQGGNSPDAALENARSEGVAERVAVGTSDVRSLAFGDGSFDVVLSHWLVHNLPTREDRMAALCEMVRVLRPGSILVVADIQHHDEYLAALTSSGLRDVRLVDDGWRPRLFGAVSFGVFRPLAIVART